jgi:hypothetical protein
MTFRNKTATLLAVCLLLISTFALIAGNFTTKAQSSSRLTGNVADKGRDTDGDGNFNYLEVAVEVNFTEAGTYRLEIPEVANVYNSTMFFKAYNETEIHAPVVAWLNLSFYGPVFRGSHFNPASLPTISLSVWKGNDQQMALDKIGDAPLSRIYNYTEFDLAATLVPTTQDEGVDSDHDGLFDELQIGVEVNVTENATYIVTVESLTGAGTYVPLYVSFTTDLVAGGHIVNVSIYGPIVSRYLRGSHGSVSFVGLSLSVEASSSFYQIDRQNGVPLSKTYVYSEFESHAFITGTAFDSGVDTDSDSLFDYLEVGVEVNVTEAGSYRISVGGLRGMRDGGIYTIYDYVWFGANLSKALHRINFTFTGPMIAYYHLDPTNVTDVGVYELSSSVQLDYRSSADLPVKYAHTQFDSPLNDMAFELTVYPNATVGLAGSSNYTHIYPLSEDPMFSASVSVSTIGSVTTASANGTVTFSGSQLGDWPLGSTTATLLAQYQNDILNAHLNATVFMPPDALTASPVNSSAGDLTLTADYTNGLVTISLAGTGQPSPEISSEFPFNITDLTVLADLEGNKIVGNVTFRTVAGFPLEDVIVHFRANETHVFITGYVNLLYSNNFGMELNATIVEELRQNYTSGLPGRGEGSLYNITGGMLECTSLNTTNTPIGPPDGARIDYNATLTGNMTNMLARYISEMAMGNPESQKTVYAALRSAFTSVQNGSFRLNFYNASKIVDLSIVLNGNVKQLWNTALQIVPGTFPVENDTMVEAWLHMANATAYALEDAHINAAYIGDQQRLDFAVSFTENVTKLKADVWQDLLDMVPQPLHDPTESFLNITDGDIETLMLSCNLTGADAEFTIRYTSEGDFRAKTNCGKILFFDAFNMQGLGPIDWGMRWLNATELDIGNFHLETQQDKYWSTIAWSGIKAYPQKDTLDSIRFKLLRWFNLTSDPQALPHEFERIRVTVTAGFNGTHTVLFSAPSTMSEPDATGNDYKSMVWQNVSISSLKDLLFKVAYQGVVNYASRTFYVPIFTNSTIGSFGFDAGARRLRFNVTGIGGTGFCNVTIPRALLYAMPSEWVISLDGVPLSSGAFNVTENQDYVFIYLPYSHSTHTVDVQGTWIVTEFPPSLLLVALTTLSLATAVVAIRQRRKLGTLVTRYQRMLRAFAGRLHQPRT